MKEEKSKQASRVGATGAGTAASTGADAEAGIGAGSAPEPSIEFKEKEIREEESAKQNFFNFMNNECPHLLLFEEPMTFEDLKVIRKKYTIEEIKTLASVLDVKRSAHMKS